MNTYFNQIVEEAIQALYCSYDIARGQEAFKKLQKASNEGDVDAMYLLARCYGGVIFVGRILVFRKMRIKWESICA